MRPLKLTMQAFGPYAKEEVIDFTEIGQEQIFVITGKTGAGKTTIFDAMSFALYGKANTNSRDGLSLRSHFASDDTLTEVTLVFSINNQIYKVNRNPQQEILKRNGEDTRVINAKAVLYKINPEEELLASNVRDVDERIAEIMQLDVNQFRQILMIPQNEFRELLVAPSKEKQLILQKLANTFVYKKVEEDLKEAQKEILSTIRSIEENIGHVQVELIQNFSEETSLAELTTKKTITQFVAKGIAEKSQFMKTAEDELSIIGMRIENATKDIAFAETKLKLWDELETALKEKEVFQKRYQEMGKIRNRLELNKRTEHLKVQEVVCKQLEEQVATYKTEIQEFTKKIAIAKKEFDVMKEERNLFLEQQAEQNEHQKELANFELYDTKITQIEQSEKVLKTLRTEISDHEVELAKTQEQIQELETKKIAYQEKEKTLNEAKFHKKDIETKVVVDEQRLKELQIRINAKKQKDQLMAERQALQTLLDEHNMALQLVLIQFNELERQKQSQHALILAETLEDGAPCPVCGSTHHPHIMIQEVSFDNILYEHTKQEVEHYEHQKQEILAEIARRDGMLIQYEQLSEDVLASLQMQKEILESELKTSMEQLQLLNRDLVSETQNTDNLLWTIKEINGLYQTRADLQEAITKKRAPEQSINAQVELLQKQIPATYLDRAYFYQKRSKLQELVETYLEKAQKFDEALAQKREIVGTYETEHNLTIRNLQKAEQELQMQKGIFEKAILHADFTDYLDYSKSILTREEESELTTIVQEFEKAFFHNQQVVENLQNQLDGEEKPNLEVLQKTYQEYLEKRTYLLDTKSKYHEQLQILQKQFATYQQLHQDLEKQEQVYRDLGEVADVANGKNHRNIGFERYVLGTFLDNILLHTNERLTKMTNGRFTLLRKNEKAKFNAQSGLDLVVFDEYTGKNRDVTSLSGGESFKTSLALALALAEVVQEMSGGISLETMFIDEGFGTLDSDSLDTAIETLLETEQSGRLVGIISHVPELKERISVKLEVTSDNNGSHTKFI